MLKNYLITAWRNLINNKLYSAINILGLAIGVSASLVIYLLVQYELSFDKFHRNGDRIYRIVSEETIPDFSDDIYYRSSLPPLMSDAVKNEATGIDEMAVFRTLNNGAKVSVPVQTGGPPTVFRKQKNIIYTDEHYFNLFKYTWIAGSPTNSLSGTLQTVLSESNAHLYFPKLSPAEIIGKEIIFDDTLLTTVTGIVKDIKQNTDLNFRTFISGASQINKFTGNDPLVYLFIKLSPGSKTQQVRDQITHIAKKYYPDMGTKFIRRFDLQPLRDIHFNNNYSAFDNRIAHKPTLYGLLAIAGFLLLLACINFINLTTAQASQRAKEIGIRKTMGSSKSQLIVQFLSETFVLTLIATIVSVAITPLLLKAFAGFIPEGLQFNVLGQMDILLFLLLLTVSVTILSGFYPALILSGYRPALVLKKILSAVLAKPETWLRKTLTLSQFVIAQVFIIATILVSRQIAYTLKKDMGFNKEAIIYFETKVDDTTSTRVSVLNNKLKALPGIAMISLSDDPITTTLTSANIMHYQDMEKKLATIVQVKMADTAYIRLYGLKLLAGRNLSHSDTIKEYIINETYAHTLGFRDLNQVIGKFIEGIPVVGVVSDFHQQSLHQKIQPIAIACVMPEQYVFNIALQRRDAGRDVWKTAITMIGDAFKEVYPEEEFQYSFLDESIAKYYQKEQDTSRLLMWSTGLSVFISCLGLLGLVIYISNQRRKEIGIRKVLGASVTEIVSLLSRDFLKLIAIAFIIAIPLAWYGASKWLDNFAYRTELSWWIFFAGGLVMLSLALLVLGIKTFKSASANPVKSLRTE